MDRNKQDKIHLSNIFNFYFKGGEFRGAPSANTIHDTQPLNCRSGSGHGSHHGYTDGPSHTENTDDCNERYIRNLINTKMQGDKNKM